MWSVGVLIYVLLCGYAPFRDEDQPGLYRKIKAGNYNFDEKYWNEISDEPKDLIRRLLTVDPKERITAEQAVVHPWLVGSTDADQQLKSGSAASSSPTPAKSVPPAPSSATGPETVSDLPGVAVEEHGLFGQQIAEFSGLHEWIGQNPAALDKIKELLSEPQDSSSSSCAGVVDRPMSKKDLRELDNLVKMAKVLQEVATSKAEDIEIQRKEGELVPDSMQQAYHATLRGGICSAYLAASVIASDMVATSKTGAMGRAGKALNLLAGVGIIPGLTTLGGGLKEGDRLLQTRSIVKITDIAVDVIECCALARRVALRLVDALHDDDHAGKPCSLEDPSSVSFEQHGPGAGFDLPGEDGEAGVEWFVDEVLGRVAGWHSKGKTSSSAKAGQRKGKTHLKLLLKAVGRGCVRGECNTGAKVDTLVQIVLGEDKGKAKSTVQGIQEHTKHESSSTNTAASHQSDTVASQSSAPCDDAAESEVSVATLMERLEAMSARLEASDARLEASDAKNSKLESEVKSMKKKLMKSLPDSDDDWVPSGEGQALKQRAVVTDTADAFFRRAENAEGARDRAAAEDHRPVTQGQLREFMVLQNEINRENDANYSDLRGAIDTKKNTRKWRR